MLGTYHCGNVLYVIFLPGLKYYNSIRLMMFYVHQTRKIGTIYFTMVLNSYLNNLS
jgi:hypothetical protein